jgi:hypothetical protein
LEKGMAEFHGLKAPKTILMEIRMIHLLMTVSEAITISL